jgi:hypothetical protein
MLVDESGHTKILDFVLRVEAFRWGVSLRGRVWASPLSIKGRRYEMGRFGNSGCIVRARWETAENNRRARFYELTTSGRGADHSTGLPEGAHECNPALLLRAWSGDDPSATIHGHATIFGRRKIYQEVGSSAFGATFGVDSL